MKLNRRQTIQSLAGGGLILPGLISDLMAAGEIPAPKRPHFAPKAKRVIFMFMTGGVSHMDTFDPKPYLNQNHNKKTGKGNRFYKGADWAFRRHGQSGTEVSELFPHIGGMMDDICVIRSMKNINGDHFGATIGIHTGSATFKRPSIGSWVSYGLGTDNANLPSFMVIAPGCRMPGVRFGDRTFFPCSIRVRGSFPEPSRSRTCTAAPPRPRCRRPSLACSSFLTANICRARERPAPQGADQIVRNRVRHAGRGAGGVRSYPKLTRHTAFTGSSAATRRALAGNAWSPAGWPSAACGSLS